MRVSLLESTEQNTFDIEDDRSGERPVLRSDDLAREGSPASLISQEVAVPRSHRPIARTVMDEEIPPSERSHDPSGCSCSALRARTPHPSVAPPPPPIRPRADTLPLSCPPPPPSGYWAYPGPAAWSPMPRPSQAPASSPTPLSFAPPALGAQLEAPPRLPPSRQILVSLLALAACLMGASLWLSATGGFADHHRGERAHGNADETSAPPTTCEMPLSELGGTPGPARLGASAAFAYGAAAAKHAESAPLAADSSAPTAAVPPASASAAPLASAAPPPPPQASAEKPIRLQQATRTSQMLREQLNSSVR
jgi:hypothetical protein